MLPFVYLMSRSPTSDPDYFRGLKTRGLFGLNDPQTGFIARITVEGSPLDSSFTVSASHRFSGATLWRIERDKDEYPSLVKYRLAAAQ